MTHTERSGKVPPPWLRWFINDASKGIVDHGTIGPIGCHYFFDEQLSTWEISLFVAHTEVIGGPLDGSLIATGLQVDLVRIKAAFDSEPATYWQSEKIADDDQLGNHVSMEGIARGNAVWLRILHEPPAFAGPGQLFHPGQGLMENLW